MKSVILAWLVGEGLMTYKDVRKNKRPPLPAELLATSGLFVLLGILGESAPKLASTLAWGFDAAAFLTLWDNPAGNAIKSKTPGSKSKTAKAK
ncbi:hypothetical protein [Streptomyces collinus]|uniref:Uncharacterized protein n=1 Tax=Streptomyces collinus (strain DSM 40733 / Tue 365) TaxID=1214242 RepID=S5VSX1_STRC3|nr:hypothetical protein [Streptomyces collinus]AGS73937.1 hypothetical protein B446_35893 [Streptomyces collinus Tu 365]